MYEYLKGSLIEKKPTSIVLEAGGVGYEVHIPLSTFGTLPSIGQEARVFIHFVVREDAHLLYGFFSEEERRLFRLLITISGIGPKIAMTMLSSRSVSEVKQAIIEGSLVFLSSIPGIGKKTAERVIVELREKLVVEERKAPSIKGNLSGNDLLVEDSLRALMELGYRKQNAREAIEKALNQTEAAKLSVSDLIRASLKYV